MAGWFDSHCHLFDCAGSPNEVAGRARAAGVTEMLVAGTDLASSRRAVELTVIDGVHAAVGVHPNSTAGWEPSWLDEVAVLTEREDVVAVGESGLDFYRDAAPEDAQRAAFDAHVDLAKQARKALVVHTRASVDAALDALERRGPPELVVFHCWSGEEPQLRRAVELGAYVSFAGTVTFKRSDELRRLAALVPDERIVIETDSPYLSPEPYRGRPNEPARAALVGEAVAAARAVEVAAFARTTRCNARRLYGLEP